MPKKRFNLFSTYFYLVIVKLNHGKYKFWKPVYEKNKIKTIEYKMIFIKNQLEK